MTTFRRFDVISRILRLTSVESAVFATTGETAREALKAGSEDHLFFPCVGGMGHASSVAYGYALQTNRPTVCLDGDGALLMHLGALTSITSSIDINFTHFLFDNGCHLSVGGNKTSGIHLNYLDLARSLKYQYVTKLEHLDQLQEEIGLGNIHSLKTRLVYVPVLAVREKHLPRPTNLSTFIERFRENWN